MKNTYRPTFTPSRIWFTILLPVFVAVGIGSAYYLAGFDPSGQGFTSEGVPIVVQDSSATPTNPDEWWTR